MIGWKINLSLNVCVLISSFISYPNGNSRDLVVQAYYKHIFHLEFKISENTGLNCLYYLGKLYKCLGLVLEYFLGPISPSPIISAPIIDRGQVPCLIMNFRLQTVQCQISLPSSFNNICFWVLFCINVFKRL